MDRQRSLVLALGKGRYGHLGGFRVKGVGGAAAESAAFPKSAHQRRSRTLQSRVGCPNRLALSLAGCLCS